MDMDKKTTVVIAEDHAIIRDGLRSLLMKTENLDVVGEAEASLVPAADFDQTVHPRLVAHENVNEGSGREVDLTQHLVRKPRQGELAGFPTGVQKLNQIDDIGLGQAASQSFDESGRNHALGSSHLQHPPFDGHTRITTVPLINDLIRSAG